MFFKKVQPWNCIKEKEVKEDIIKYFALVNYNIHLYLMLYEILTRV